MSTSGTGKLARQRYLPHVYYQAIRDLQPVWKLEDMRTMETFYLDKQQRRRTFTPSEALLYAIVHDHQAYAQYLLSHYAEKALAMPSKYFCYIPASVPHLMMAVRYNRREILGLVLQVARQVPSFRTCLNQGGCFNFEDNKTPLHLACELLHYDAVILLLCNGASTQVEDQNGMTPLDIILQKLRDSEVNMGAKKQCLDNLLLFAPVVRFKMKSSLEEERVRWTHVLGEETLNYLVGLTPAPLLLIAMQKILRLLPSDKLLESLHQLDIPSSLKSLPVASNQLELLRSKD